MLSSQFSSPASGVKTQLDTAQAAHEAAQLKRAKIKKACQMFESHFLKLMWTEMRKTIPKTGLFSGGHAENIFTDMLDQQRAEAASAGRSMGLADMLQRQLSRSNLKRPAQYFGGHRLSMDKPQSGHMVRGIIRDPWAVSGLDRHDGSSEATDTVAAAAGGQAATAGAGFVSPLRGRISSLYGNRVHPISGKLAHHDGVDVAAPKGTPIRAAGAGRVVFAGWADGYGNLVEVEHADGRTTRYAHCDKLQVKAGQQVTSGQDIATVGSTGRSTGPHLHFEIIDAKGKHIDPMQMVALGTAPHIRRS